MRLTVNNGDVVSWTIPQTAADVLAAPQQGRLLIPAITYGVVADTQISQKGATTILNSSTITCVGTVFTQADIGKIVWVMNGFNLIVPQSTILTVNSPNSITVSNAATSSVSTGMLIWGTDDTLALQAAWAAAVQTNGSVLLPAGYMLTQAPQFNTNTNSYAANFYGQPAVQGQGKQASLIIPTPNFVFTPSNTVPQFCGAPFSLYKGFAIYGTGYSPAGGANKTLAGNNGGFLEEMDFSSWCNFCAGSTGLVVSGGTSGCFFGGVEYFGVTGITLSAATGAQLFSFVSYGGTIALNVTNNSVNLVTMGCYLPGKIVIAAGSSWASYSDLGGGNGLQINGTADLHDFLYTASVSTPLLLGATGKIIAQGCNFPSCSYGNSPSVWAVVTEGGSILDMGGNVFNGLAVSSAPYFVGNSSHQTTGLTNTQSFLTTAGDLVLVAVQWNLTDNQTLSSVSDGVNTYTQLGNTLTTNSTYGVEKSYALFYCNGAATTATLSVTATFSGSVTSSVSISEWGGQWPVGSPFDQYTSTTGDGTTLSSGATLTTTVANDLAVLLGVCNISSDTLTLTSSLAVQNQSTTVGDLLVYQYGTGTNLIVPGTYTLGGSFVSNTDWAAFWLQIKPALSPTGLFTNNSALINPIKDFGSAPSSVTTAGLAGEIVTDKGALYFCSVTGAAGSATWNSLNMTTV